jgi:hypothetical protein
VSEVNVTVNDQNVVNVGCEDRLADVRRYVEANRDVWSDDPHDQLSVAIADVYQKVLNVIDTGNPLIPIPTAED